MKSSYLQLESKPLSNGEIRVTESYIDQYPELTKIAKQLADEFCSSINQRVSKIESDMPYKRHYVLEEVIRLLEQRA